MALHARNAGDYRNTRTTMKRRPYIVTRPRPLQTIIRQYFAYILLQLVQLRSRYLAVVTLHFVPWRSILFCTIRDYQQYGGPETVSRKYEISAESLTTFRQRLKTHLFSKSFPGYFLDINSLSWTPTLTLYSGLSSGLYYSSHYKNLDWLIDWLIDLQT